MPMLLLALLPATPALPADAFQRDMIFAALDIGNGIAITEACEARPASQTPKRQGNRAGCLRRLSDSLCVHALRAPDQ